MENYNENNVAILIGKIISERRYSHDIHGEAFYKFDLEITKLNGAFDIIPVIASTKILKYEHSLGAKVKIEGSFMSDKSEKNGVSSHFVHAKSITIHSNEANYVESNSIVLCGKICRNPNYKVTSLGKEICDVLLAVTRNDEESDLIPCITFAHNANVCKNLKIGQNVKIVGRIKVKPQEKYSGKTSVEEIKLYEVFVSKIELYVEKKEEKSSEIKVETKQTATFNYDYTTIKREEKTAGKTEKEKMLSGEEYNGLAQELMTERLKTKELCFEYNNLKPSNMFWRKEQVKKILGKIDGEFLIEQPFMCDYGYNIEIGDNFYANHNLIILDSAKVTFGKNVFVGPNCTFYTAEYLIDAKERSNGIEYAKPIQIGDNVWFGGNVTVLPGVKIGENSVIGVGSVVTSDIPSNSIAAGNPCRVINKMEKD